MAWRGVAWRSTHARHGTLSFIVAGGPGGAGNKSTGCADKYPVGWCLNPHPSTPRQTDGQTDRQTDRQTEQTDRHV